MSYLQNAVNTASKKRAVGASVCAAALAMACAVPAFAQAPTATTTGEANANSATTDVYLVMDADAQLSVTAPTKVQYVLNTDGTFTTPTDVKITNNSVVPVAVKSTTVADQTAGKATAVTNAAFAAATDANAWWNQAVGKAGAQGAADGATIELNQENATFGKAWNMGTKDGKLYNDTQSNEIGFTLTGAMKNLDGHIDFNSEQNLQKVAWTFGTVMN